MREKLFFFCLLICFPVLAQDEHHATGLLPDDGTYNQLPRKAELISRDYKVLPSKHSLMMYCPEVKSQSKFATCTGWATAYAARTIMEAIKYGWTDKRKITSEAFSPLFVYALIKTKYPKDDDCQEGTCIYDALKLMKEKGVSKFSSFDVLCADYVTENLISAATHFKIDDYFTLFSMNHVSPVEKISKVKKSLSEDCPVVIAMWLPKSFHSAGTTWDGIDIDPSRHDYHAMCVIGYDDDKDGGAFQIMNSWGSDWGDNGFVWVKYDDFSKYVDQAYELYVTKLTNSAPNRMMRQLTTLNSFASELDLELSTGEKMIPILDSIQGMAHYRMADSYISKTRYRIYISNNEPAYVYVIGSDLSNNVSKIFPPKDNVSAALTYKSNHIAIPDETYYVEMDNTKGIDYMCILYSKYALNINQIIADMKSKEGSFYEKLQSVLSGRLAPEDDVHYLQDKFGFRTTTKKTVVPLIVEIEHQ